LLAMERADVERLIQQKPQVGIRMISLLSERLHYYETRMQDVTLKEVPARLASLILFLVESEGVIRPGEIGIPTRYTHEHLGTMIGANREAVTRAFGHLQDEGALQMRRRFIYVQDVEALERAAGRLLEEGAEEAPLLLNDPPPPEATSSPNTSLLLLLSASRSSEALSMAAVAFARSTSRSSTICILSWRLASLDHSSM
jgi:hypothetical protein